MQQVKVKLIAERHHYVLTPQGGLEPFFTRVFDAHIATKAKTTDIYYNGKLLGVIQS